VPAAEVEQVDDSASQRCTVAEAECIDSVKLAMQATERLLSRVSNDVTDRRVARSLYVILVTGRVDASTEHHV